MSAPVDVLAVMACAMEEISRYRETLGLRDRSITVPDLREARAAVAELIAATEALVESGDEGADHGSVAKLRWGAAKVRVAVALARCKGGAA